MPELGKISRRTKSDELRPAFHFTAPKNWLNDPNGLVHWNGKYHMFYQHNPESPEWGLIHWGHAVSDDLVHWEDLPIALAPTPDSPDERGVWSGCFVNDNGTPTLVYTGVRGGLYEEQTICIATSSDPDLLTWQKSEANPILVKMPSDLSYSGFRDPFIWRQDGLWKMVIGAGATQGPEAVLLYEGESIYEWRYVGPLYVNDEQNEHVYECPNFFKLGDKWVLLVSIMPTSHVEYFVGLFWNNHFIVESHGKLGNHPLYAPLTFEDKNGRRLMIGWLQETRGDEISHDLDWSGAMSVPMELMLLENNQLVATPAREILNSSLPTSYRQFHDVHIEDLAKIQAELPSKRLKVVISDDLSKVVFIDGSVVEYFDFPDYRVGRVYDGEADLTVLEALLKFPQKRIGIYTMPETI